MAAQPPEFDWFAAALSSALGLIGRLMYLANERRQPFSMSLAWELPIAVGMGLIGRGIGEYIGATGFFLFSLSIVTAYVGPRLISWAVAQYMTNTLRR